MKKFPKTIITGAGGMVGSYIDFGLKTDKQELNVTNLAQAMKLVKKHKPKVIIHLAAMTDVDQCERDPNNAYLINSIGTYHMVLAAKSVNAKFVYVSTAGVFDGTKKNPYDIRDKANPINFYGKSKYLGEIFVQEFLEDYIIARVCWMFGGGPVRDKKFISKILSQRDKQEIMAVSDQYGSPTFGKDLIENIKQLVLNNQRGIFHLANTGVCSRFDYAKEIVSVVGLPIKVKSVRSIYFKLDAIRTSNEGLISYNTRPWQEAVREYINTEWKNI